MAEDSAKRQERLRAMRMEAETEAAPSPASPPAHLSNPLLPLPHAPHEISPPPSRFNYYTDPMSVFSSNKRRSPFHHSDGGFSPSPVPRPSSSFAGVGSWNYQMNTMHAPAHQFHSNQSPDQRSLMYPPPGGSWRSPVQCGIPYSDNKGSSFSGSHTWSQSGGSSGPRFPAYSRGGSMSPSLGSSGMGSNPMSGSGRGSFYSNRGRFNNHGRRWNSGESVQVGVSAQKDVSQFYKSMLKDPWRKLEPVVGNILVPRSDAVSWLPKSLTAKKAKITESGNKFNSHSSLAEYLASSLEEAVDDIN